jgi:hypothetical protein
MLAVGGSPANVLRVIDDAAVPLRDLLRRSGVPIMESAHELGRYVCRGIVKRPCSQTRSGHFCPVA